MSLFQDVFYGLESVLSQKEKRTRKHTNKTTWLKAGNGASKKPSKTNKQLFH